MKKLMIYIFLGSTLFFFLKCKEEESPENPFSMIVSGRLMDSCNGNPLPNFTIQVYANFVPRVNIFDDDNPEKLLAKITTDANGNFNSNIEAVGNIYPYSIRYKSGLNTFMLASGTLVINERNVEVKVGDLYRDGWVKNTFIKFNHVTKFKSDKVVIFQNNSPNSVSDTFYVNPPTLLTAFEAMVPMRYNIKNIGDGEAKFYANYIIKWMDGNVGYQNQNQWIYTKYECTQSLDSVMIRREQ